MQNAFAIGCFVVLLLVGIPFAFKYPWRAAMVTAFFAVHIAVMVGYAALIELLAKSQHPAARRLITAHAVLSDLMADDALPDGAGYSKTVRRTVQVIVYLSAFVFYGWLLLTLGDLLDWLEKP
jgi:hypothetical protein